MKGCVDFHAVKQAVSMEAVLRHYWLNQVEIYFSTVQRKVLTPNDFSSLAELEQRLMAFQCLL